MNASQIHLALTHVPVIFSIIGLAILLIALIRKNDTLTKTSYYIFLAAGIFALPVYFTGEGAEGIIENLPGVSEGVIEKHQEFAGISLAIILICAAISLAALFLYKYFKAARIMKYAVLLFASGSVITLVQTAHLGGQIRHTEIQTAASSNEKANEGGEKGETGGQETGMKNEGKADD